MRQLFQLYAEGIFVLSDGRRCFARDMQCVVGTCDSISTRERSFLELCEAIGPAEIACGAADRGQRAKAPATDRGFSLRLLESHDFISSGTQRGENISENVPRQKNNYSNGRENWGNHWHVRFIVVAAL
jgi:hypothetical protein